MRVKVEASEIFPIYDIAELWDRDTSEAELTEQELQDFLECKRKFFDWQNRLEDNIRKTHVKDIQAKYKEPEI